MNWSDSKPTVAGWYWYRKYKNWTARCVKVHWEILPISGNTLMFNGWDVKMDTGQWAGPIPEPN